MQKLAEQGRLTSEDGIQKRVLSIHDHWLSMEEATTDAISFAVLNSLQEYRFYLREEDKFVALFATLFRNSDAFYLDTFSSTALPLEGWQKLISLTTKGLREQGKFVFYLRRFQVLLASAHDLNVAVYFLDPQQQDPFAELANGYELYLLEELN
ncbi:hypothetical protein [Hymenobacter volaticus]|uniref:Uncharacterized protein n=1 Tax=Hymenobacter volaticus TaxID=2932254 RepID=A0ABY4G4M9_9BACT|nr:hypothetical protein [Hymenobacter volaticus]UOQ65849.1 hypothetical protein MUN86_20355 [Hymenobacter volaticus]